MFLFFLEKHSPGAVRTREVVDTERSISSLENYNYIVKSDTIFCGNGDYL